MNKIITAIVLTLLFGASHVFAQSYYQTPSTTSAYGGGCISIPHDLSVGSTGSDVLSLQKFIISRNYPGGGTWMLTGYYGSATRAGVIDFQIDAHVPQTGILDGATRAALSQITCGYGYNQTNPNYLTYPTQTYQSYTNNSTYPWNNVQPWYTTPGNVYGNTGYNSNCGWYTVAGHNYFNDCGISNPTNTIYPNYNTYPYNNYGGQNSPTISNISGPTSININTTGTWIVSINNPYGATNASISVDWGDVGYSGYTNPTQQVYGNSSATFTHVYQQNGTYTIRFTVNNGYGSNSSTASVQVNGNSNYYNGAPMIYSITPSYGPVGTQITIYGTGFSGDNIVHFGNGGIAHVTSASGNYIYYTIPSSVTPCTVQINGSTGCPQYAQQVTSGQYQVYITTNGVNSNSLTYTVQ